MKNLYRGYSTFGWRQRRSLTSTNIDLVKRDILNHIYTIKGERPMMPNFGTRIPMMAFEPNDFETRKIIEDDIREVCTYDPRVQLMDLRIVSLPDNNAIIAAADLLYIEFNVREVLHIEVATQ